MDVELLVTGDEIVTGRVSDTNSAWLLERLVALGAKVRRVVAVGDEKAELLAAMRDASERSELVVVSGGLGPTSDDLSAECAAELVGERLVLHEPTVALITERWARRGRPMPFGVEKQALVPESALVLQNDEGTAPGFRLKHERATLFFLAGVPREFRHLCERHVLPWLESRSAECSVTRVLKTASLTESELDARLSPLAFRHGLRLGLRAVFPESSASLTASAPTRELAETRLEEALQEALGLLGNDCYSSQGESHAQVLGELLVKRRQTLAVAESCTGGLLGAAISAVPGASRLFLGGSVSYSNEEKERALGVPASLLAAHGAVSEEVALAMAEGARQGLGADWALSITGVAGPGGGSEEKPVGTVWIGLSGPGVHRSHLLRSMRRDRDSIRQHSVTTAIELLRRELIGAGS